MMRRILPIIILFAIIAMLMVIIPVHGDSSLDSPQQTWPSRTPTSSAPSNQTQPPPAGGTPAPPAPEGSPPAPDATGSVPATQPALPADEFLPTAAPCQRPPTAMALGASTVRSGPGIAYDRVGNLTFAEVRIIIGRSQYFSWWQILLANDQAGWIAAEAVDVQGDTSEVPVISPPLLDGSTPEPGPEWQPTVDPICIMTISADGASPSPIQVTQVPAENPGSEISISATDEQVEAAIATRPPVEEEDAVPDAGATRDVTEQPDTGQVRTTGNGSNPNWILGAGLLLIIAAAVIYLSQRRSN